MHVAVYITTRNEKEAVKIASILLKERLVACANIMPKIESAYWWKGKLKKHSEALLIAKTRKELMPKIIATVKKHHSYSVPCVNAIPIVKGNPDFLKWLDEELKTKKKK